ncbi:C-type lectin domain family 14 member A [Zootoca vivipara]|uniref:C-type lectin domain family 14 member A n=1 Tax=Zootoca vivipara TaxID=8524 RepID=UPI00293BD967|nr:C-type lectin domain family 14 member A [Zootoca vivipara]
MRGLVLASLVLLQPLSVPGGPTAAVRPQSDHARCHPSGSCYSVHVGSLSFPRAQDACAAHGGHLSTASGRVEVQAIVSLLRGVARGGSGTSLFWLGLVRKAQQCTMEELPLRGFSWAAAGGLVAEARNESAAEGSLSWVKEPSKSCTTQKCAGLQVTWGEPRAAESWGLAEHACAKANAGYVCKYSYAGACPAPSAGNHLNYALPFRLQSAAVEFGPPGTVLTLRCPGREARFTCRLSPDGYRWEGTERGLCSCPSGYWSLSEGACVELADCFGARGAFLCLCAWGAGLAADEKACVPPAGTETPPSPALSPSPNGSSDGLPGWNDSLAATLPSEVGNSSSAPGAVSSNYLFILITVAVVTLVILVMAALQIFQACFRFCCSKGSQTKKDGAPATTATTADGDPEASATRTDSDHSLGPSKAESADASQDEPKPVAEQEQPRGD